MRQLRISPSIILFALAFLASGLFGGEAVLLSSFGAVGTDNLDDSKALQKALDAVSAGGTLMVEPGTYMLHAGVEATISNDVEIIGLGNPKFIAQGTFADRLLDIQIHDASLGIYGIHVDANRRAAQILRVRHSKEPATHNECIVSSCVFQRCYLPRDRSVHASLILVQAAFDLLHIKGSHFSDVNRATGAGKPSALGCSGISINPYQGAACSQIVFETIKLSNITNSEADDSPRNGDADGIQIFGLDFAKTSVLQESVVIRDSLFVNNKGRHVKSTVENTSIQSCTFRRMGQVPILHGVDIDLQFGGGRILGNQFDYLPDANNPSQRMFQRFFKTATFSNRRSPKSSLKRQHGGSTFSQNTVRIGVTGNDLPSLVLLHSTENQPMVAVHVKDNSVMGPGSLQKLVTLSSAKTTREAPKLLQISGNQVYSLMGPWLDPEEKASPFFSIHGNTVFETK